MLRIFLLYCFIVSAIQVNGQTYSPVQDLEQFKIRMKESATKTNSLVADFKQEKTLSALTETITSTGKFWFKRTNKVRMEYEKPFVYRMIINGDKIHIKDSQKDYAINAGSNKLFQQINRIVVDCVQGTILENKDFKATVLEGTKNYQIKLVPVSKGLKDFYSSIVLLLSKQTMIIESLEMQESGSDVTIMYFNNVRQNATVEDSVFIP